MAKPNRILPGWPRGLIEDLAAAYVGLSVSTFRTDWRAGRAHLEFAAAPPMQEASYRSSHRADRHQDTESDKQDIKTI